MKAALPIAVFGLFSAALVAISSPSDAALVFVSYILAAIVSSIVLQWSKE